MSHDLIIRDVRVVRPGVEDVTHADIAVDDGRITAVGAGPRHRRRAGRRRPRPARLPRRRRRPPALGHLQPAGRGRRDREPRLRAGRRDHRADLHAHRAVLPEQGRRLRRLLPRGARRRPRAAPYVDYAFHLAPMQRGAHRRDPRRWSTTTASRRSRSSCSTAATACTGASTDQSVVPDDPRGRALRLSRTSSSSCAASRRRARAAPGASPTSISLSLHCETAEIMTAYTQLVEEEGTPDRARGLQRLAAAALRGPGGHHRVVPRARDRAADDQPAAPDRRARRSRRRC